MAVSVKNSIEINVKATESRVDDLGTAQKVHAFGLQALIPNGTASNQNDVVWSDKRTATTSGDTFNLRALTDNALQNVSVAKITFLAIKNLGAATLSLGDAANPVTSLFAGTNPVVNIGPGGVLVLANAADGYEVPSTTGNLKVASSTGTIDYEILVVGRSV